MNTGLIESDWNLKLIIMAIIVAIIGINRIRLEFKAQYALDVLADKIGLIESDWNLKWTIS